MSVCLFVFFSEGGELDPITLLFYKPFPPPVPSLTALLPPSPLFTCFFEFFFFSEGGELDLITLLFYKPFPPRPFPYCTSTTLSSFYLFLRVDFLVCLFIGVRLLHSTRRVPGGLGRVSNPSQLSHVQNVLLSLWGDAGKLFKFVGVKHVQFSHLLIDIA